MPTTMPTMRYFLHKSPTTMPTMRYFSNTRTHTITNETRTKYMFEIPQPHQVPVRNTCSKITLRRNKIGFPQNKIHFRQAKTIFYLY